MEINSKIQGKKQQTTPNLAEIPPVPIPPAPEIPRKSAFTPWTEIQKTEEAVSRPMISDPPRKLRCPYQTTQNFLVKSFNELIMSPHNYPFLFEKHNAETPFRRIIPKSNPPVQKPIQKPTENPVQKSIRQPIPKSTEKQKSGPLHPSRPPTQPKTSAPQNPNVSRFLDSRSSIPIKDRKCCKCKKSQCLLLYCDCFRAGQICEGCNCLNCRNTSETSKERYEAIQKILDVNPLAFEDEYGAKASKGCKCRKSGCKKGYCQCFQQGKGCSTDCVCTNCQNYAPGQQEAGSRQGNGKKEREVSGDEEVSG